MPIMTGSGLGDVQAVYAFSVEVDGLIFGQFQAAEGMSMEISVIEHQENKIGGLPVLVKLPGHVKYGDITLKRGRISNNEMWDWMKMVQDGDVDGARKNGSIVLLDYTRGEIGRFNFENGWPSKVEIAGVDASSDDILMETVTITHEGLRAA